VAFWLSSLNTTHFVKSEYNTFQIQTQTCDHLSGLMSYLLHQSELCSTQLLATDCFGMKYSICSSVTDKQKSTSLLSVALEERNIDA